MSLEIFGPTISTRWDKQTKNLKYELTNRLVVMFSSETFNRVEVLKKDGRHMNIVRDQFRVHIERKPRYDLLPMILAREGISLV